MKRNALLLTIVAITVSSACFADKPKLKLENKTDNDIFVHMQITLPERDPGTMSTVNSYMVTIPRKKGWTYTFPEKDICVNQIAYIEKGKANSYWDQKAKENISRLPEQRWFNSMHKQYGMIPGRGRVDFILKDFLNMMFSDPAAKKYTSRFCLYKLKNGKRKYKTYKALLGSQIEVKD